MYQKPGTILSVSVVFNTTNGIDILVLVKILKPQTNKPQTPSHNLHRIVSRIVHFPIPASKLSQRSTILPAAMQNNDKLLFILVFNIWLNLCKFSKLYTSSSFGFSGQVSPQQIFHPHYFCGPIFCILLPSYVTFAPAMSSLTSSINLLSGLPRFLFPGSAILSILLSIYPSSFLHRMSKPPQSCLNHECGVTINYRKLLSTI